MVPRNVDLSAPEIQVQPFSLRMSKLSHVMKLPLSDPLFSALYQQRYTLGDHDYARALRPDRRWSARKISVWIKGLLPVCESDRFKALYPAVAAAPDALIARAYGRPADALDSSAITDALAGGDGTNDDALVCLALLSSLEFVAQ